MNGQDPEFEVPTFGSLMTCICYVLAQSVIALLGLLAVALISAGLIGICA